MAAPVVGNSSPWGAIDHVEVLADGIVAVSTASHGGIWLSPERYAKMPGVWRDTFAGGPWYEEDCDWCLVALAFPSAFDEKSLASARLIAERYKGIPAGAVALIVTEEATEAGMQSVLPGAERDQSVGPEQMKLF